MSLDVDSAVFYFLKRGLIETEAIVAGDLRFRSALRRNRNLRVESRRGACYLFKEPDPAEHGGDRTLATEAGFYSLSWREPAAAPVAAFLPRLYHHDADGPRLVLELFADARNLEQELAAHSSDGLPLDPWRSLGKALGTVHAVFRGDDLAEHPFVAGLHADAPWILTIHRPHPDLISRLHSAHLRTLRILQTEEPLAARLHALLPRWRVETLIHGDVKSDNFLVLPEDKDGPGVRLVDWELAQRGDPAWDVAAALQEVLVFWIRHMPQDVELEAGERVSRARYPLAVLQPAVRAFWHSYRQSAGLDPAAAGELLGRAVPFSAARLIQSAYEVASRFERLPAPSVLMLQVAANVLARPDHAAFHLYGLPVDPTGSRDASG